MTDNIQKIEINPDNMINLLNTTVNTLNPDLKGDTFWLSRIVANWHERAVGYAVNSVKSGYPDAMTRLSNQLHACQGIAQYFKLDVNPDLAWTIANLGKSENMTLEGNMLKKISSFPRTYGINKESIPANEAQDAIDNLSFDITEKDIERADKMNDTNARIYLKENRASIRKAHPEANLMPKMVKVVLDEKLIEIVPPLSAYEFLEFKAQESVNMHKEQIKEAWDKVNDFHQSIHYGKEYGNINAIHSVDETALYWWVTSMEATIGRALESAKRKWEKASDDNNARDEITFKNEVNGLMIVRDNINQLLHSAEEVNNTNTSKEIIDDSPVSDNLAENATHDYEVTQNIPH